MYLVVDLAGVISCDHRLFDVLARTHQVLADRQGSEFLLVCQSLLVNDVGWLRPG